MTTTDSAGIARSCKTCPSYLFAEEAPGIFNRSTGAPMCRTYGEILGRPGMPLDKQNELCKIKAEKCDRYGLPPAAAPVARNMTVMLPDPTVRDPANIDSGMKAACISCATCQNFVSEDTVFTELGWTTGACRAKGKLLLTNKLSAEAVGCEYRQFGLNANTTLDLMLLPEYTFGTKASVESAVIVEELSHNFIEPSEYPTDRELTDDDVTAGIRAWRKFKDPEGTDKCVYFPVYDSSKFSEELRELVPKTGSMEHPELYVDHFGGMYALGVAWMELDETPALWGISGIGKTELLRYAAWIMQLPFHRISVTHSMDLDDLLGKYEYSPEEGTHFRFGRLPKAWVQPGIVCLDEPNTGQPDVWQAIRPLTDNSKQLVLDMYDGKPLDRDADSYLGLAMNPAWDVRNIGALEIGDADTNRLWHIFMNLPPEELERKIIKDRVALDGWTISNKQLNYLMKTAQEIRGMAQQDQLPITWAIRPQLKVARALRWFSPATAYRRAAADFMEPEAQKVLMDIVKANWPNED